MLKQLICSLRHGHEYVQFDKTIYQDGYPMIRYGKECRLCGKVKWLGG